MPNKFRKKYHGLCTVLVHSYMCTVSVHVPEAYWEILQGFYHTIFCDKNLEVILSKLLICALKLLFK